MFLWQLFLVRLHLAQFLFPLSEQVNGHVPACPIFLLAHPANGRNARLGQCMVYHPAVHEVFGAEAVMVDDFPHAAVNEHIAYGHQATGTVDIFRDKIITQVAYMICQPGDAHFRRYGQFILCPVFFPSVSVHITIRSQICTGVKNCPCACCPFLELSAMKRSPNASYQDAASAASA